MRKKSKVLSSKEPKIIPHKPTQLSAIAKLNPEDNKEDIYLEFPLMKYPKQYIYQNTQDDIRNIVTWCESHDKIRGRGCGVCVSCHKMKFYFPFLFQSNKDTKLTLTPVSRKKMCQ